MAVVFGLIGGIGSGKSLVAGFFAELGARVIEGDKLGHEGLRQPALRDQVKHRWGKQILDGTGEVDRKILGQIVFADPRERQALEAMLFPHIERRIGEEIEKASREPAVNLIILDAAVLLEAGWDKFCGMVIFVDAPREQRLQRVLQQRGWTEKEVTARESAQLAVEEKAARADAVVDNSGDPADTRRQVQQLYERLRDLRREAPKHQEMN